MIHTICLNYEHTLAAHTQTLLSSSSTSAPPSPRPFQSLFFSYYKNNCTQVQPNKVRRVMRNTAPNHQQTNQSVVLPLIFRTPCCSCCCFLYAITIIILLQCFRRTSRETVRYYVSNLCHPLGDKNLTRTFHIIIFWLHYRRSKDVKLILKIGVLSCMCELMYIM